MPVYVVIRKEFIPYVGEDISIRYVGLSREKAIEIAKSIGNSYWVDSEIQVWVDGEQTGEYVSIY